MRRTAAGVALLFLLPLGLAPVSQAGEADVSWAEAKCSGTHCEFKVTVVHDEEGWDHYSNRWEILREDGELIVTRQISHPHQKGRPFTTRLPPVPIPAGVERARVRAHDKVHGYGGKEIVVELSR